MSAITMTPNPIQHSQKLPSEIEHQQMHALATKVSNVFLGMALIIGALLLTGPVGFIMTTAVVALVAVSLSARECVRIDHDYGHAPTRWRFPAFRPVMPAPPILRPANYHPAPQRVPVGGGRYGSEPVRVPVGAGRRWFH